MEAGIPDSTPDEFLRRDRHVIRQREGSRFSFFRRAGRLLGGPADELCAPGYTAQIGANPPMPLAGHQQFAAMFYAAFSGLHHVIEDTVAEADKVAVRFTLHGTHSGDFMGLPATGRTIVVPAIAILRVADGKVTHLHAVFDQAGMMRQLGV
jgi:steroid delta-isomerase-like uncharacterized protein